MNVALAADLLHPEQLLDKVAELKKAGFRLVQVAALRDKQGSEDFIRLVYSFDRANFLRHLQVLLPLEGATIPSITSVFWSAFLYENEIHDLYGVQVTGLALDFHGTLYKTTIRFPFGSTKPPTSKATAENGPNP